MADVPPWLAVMRSIDGTHEGAGSGDNPTILGWARFIGQQYPEMAAYCAQYTHDEISWCGLTVAYCMAKAGIRPAFGPSDTDRFLWALAWKQFGNPVSKDVAQPGDVGVFVWASGGHHVTLIEGQDGDRYICHGGNQSDAVNVQKYAKAYCVAVRRPSGVAKPLPIPTPGPSPDSLPHPTPAGLPPFLMLLEEAASLLGRARLADDPAAAQRIQRLRGELMVGREVADLAIALLDKLAPPPGPSPGPAPAPTHHGFPGDVLDWLKHPPPLSIPGPQPQPQPGPSPAPLEHVQKAIIATMFGGAGDFNRSAYDNHVIRDDEPGCALPFHFPGSRPQISILGPNGATTTVPIVDVGPIYPSPRGPADPYWETGSRPRAETQGALSRAGIDLTPATAHTLGIDGKGKVDWWFATQPVSSLPDDEPPPVQNNPIIQLRNATMDEQTQAILAGLIRHGLTAAGGWMATKGYLDSSQISGFAGAGMILVGAAWSWWQKVGQAQAAQLLKKLTHAPTTDAAIAKAQVLPAGSAVTRGLP